MSWIVRRTRVDNFRKTARWKIVFPSLAIFSGRKAREREDRHPVKWSDEIKERTGSFLNSQIY